MMKREIKYCNNYPRIRICGNLSPQIKIWGNLSPQIKIWANNIGHAYGIWSSTNIPDVSAIGTAHVFTIPRLKPGVTKSSMPTALDEDEFMADASAIGTAHVVTAEFIPLNYTTHLTTASAVGTADLVSREFIPLPLAPTNLKTNEPCKP